MNGLDLFLLIIVVIGGVNGLRQGFIQAFANLIGWFVAFFIALKYATTLAPLMVISSDPVLQKVAAFALIVLVIVIATWLLTGFLQRVLHILKLSPLNRLAGAVFGILKALLVILILLQTLSPWVASSPKWQQSTWVQALLPYAPWATEQSKKVVAEAKQHFKEDHSSLSSEREDSETATKNPFN
ncbi:CvpA family protein [Acinetobacter sp. B51(2017)]|uniref:CvpA family protein n=1 Tax=Acinetobacter sp. B51(2017) TaxID=2060938 RepID=UPI000F09840A|nr:CvpA family protein [Acinetobacter sp. B51(2017)]